MSRMKSKFKIYQITKRIRKRMKEIRTYYPSVTDISTRDDFGDIKTRGDYINKMLDYKNAGRYDGFLETLMIIKEVMNER